MKHICIAAVFAALTAFSPHYALAAECYGMDENLNSVPVDCSTGERIYSPAEKAVMAAQRRKEAASRAAEEKKKAEEESKAKAEAEAKAKSEAEAKKEAERKTAASAAKSEIPQRKENISVFDGIKKIKIGRKTYSINSVYFSGDTALIEASQELPKWELSGYYFQPSFADEPIGYYGNDVEAATVKAAYGGTLSYSLWPWLAIGAGYENVGKTKDYCWREAFYTYKGWMVRMKLTLNPSNTFRIYLPVSVGRYEYKLQYEDNYYEYVNYYSYWHYYSRNEVRTKTVITGGGGIEIGLSRNIAFAGEYLFPLYQGGSPGKLKNQINARINYRW